MKTRIRKNRDKNENETENKGRNFIFYKEMSYI